MVSDALTGRLVGSARTVCGERPMRINCPNCATSYHLDPSALGLSGRSVRCVRCRTVWFAANTEALSEIAASHRADMEQFAAAEPAVAPPPSGWPEELLPSEAAAPTDTIMAPDEAALAALQTEPAAAPDMPPDPMPVVESPALAPTEQEGASLPEDIESVAARRALEQARRRRLGLPLPSLPTTFVALVLVNLGLIAWRADIVRLVPQTASFFGAIGLPVNLRGLVISDVITTAQAHDGVPVLVVQGRIVSVAKRTVEVPRLRFAVRNELGNEIYNWTALPSRSLLGPGETLTFQSRLASPPPEAHDVLVRFFSRRDIGAGIE
jgi:predicted Zn finger-like uncharacterized protein